MNIEAESYVSSFLELSKEFGVSLKVGTSLVTSAIETSAHPHLGHTSTAIDIALIETTTGRILNVNGKPAILGPTQYYGIIISEATYKERLKRFYELFFLGGDAVISTHKAEVGYKPECHEKDFEELWGHLLTGAAKNFNL